MPGSKSLAQALLDLDRNTGYSPSVQRYLAYYTVAPDGLGGGTEYSGTGYTRAAHSPTAGAQVGSTDQASSSNSGVITWPLVQGAPVTIVGTALMTTQTPGTGQVIYYDPSITPQTVPVGQAPFLPAGATTFTET
jgi:hypothetical protein